MFRSIRHRSVRSAAPSRFRKIRVIIADDAEELRVLVARAVRAAGHEVVREAADESAAIDAARDEAPDALIIDSRLPPAGAPQAIAGLRAAAPRTAILVLASLDERTLVRDAVAAGARGPLLRPVRASAVAEMLNALAGESRE